MRKCDDAVARKTHPKKSGTIASIRAGLRPQRSMMGPEANEPIGVARLCTLAEKRKKKRKRLDFKKGPFLIFPTRWKYVAKLLVFC